MIPVPTVVPVSLIIRPLIAGDPPPVTDFQVQPPEPFAVKTKLSVPVPPLVSCIPVGFIFDTVSNPSLESVSVVVRPTVPPLTLDALDVESANTNPPPPDPL